MLPAYVFVFGRAFIALWIHPRYVLGPVEARSDIVLAILLCGFVPRFLQSISWQFLAGAGKLGVMLWITVAEAVTSIALCATLVHSWGILGVAVGTAIPIFLSNTFIVPSHVLRTIGIGRREYWQKGVLRPLGCGVVAFLSGMAMKNLVPPDSWSALIFDAAVSGTAGLAILFTVGFDSDDRELARTKIKTFYSRIQRPA
jgi:O-antigen/teichoic acid export membrane protein